MNDKQKILPVRQKYGQDIFGMVKRAFLKTSFFSKNESTKNFHYHKQEVYCDTTNGPRFKQN